MQPADLAHLAVPGDPQLHPDGVRVAYVVTTVDLDGDRYVRTIHLWDGTGARRFTAGPSDGEPRWSPDGRWLAFVRKAEGEDATPQLMVMPADGGEPEARTDLPLGVREPAWSPDSTQLVVVGTAWVDELADLADEERRRRPKRITRLPYRSDTRGWLHDRRDRLWLVAATGDGEPRCLTPGDGNRSAPSWRPDGRAVAFLTDETDLPDTEPEVRACEVDVDTGAVTELAGPGLWSAVHHAPDGRVVVTGLRALGDWPGCNALWLVAEGGLVPLTAHLDRDVVPGSPGCVTVGPRFVDGGLLTALEGRGTSGVVRVELDGWDPARGEPPRVVEVVGGDRCVTGYAARPDGGAVVFTATDPGSPGELFRLEGGGEQRLTDLTSAFRAQVDVRPAQRFTVERDGAEIDVWAVLPPGFDGAPEGSVPVLLNIHGGPTAQYGEYHFDEFQVGAGAGYLVVGANPRGSSGRGAGWARAVVGAWTREDSVDTLDLEAVVDATLARLPQADPERVGVMGGSYGGFATARLLARSGRYRSAIVERGLLQWESFSGTSDIGPFFDRMFLEASLADGADAHHAASPVRAAGSITTPTLVLHSEHDWRCPIEQAEQFFTALRRAGVPSEMVRFPDEGHELSRSGAPKHRVERFEVVLDWHGRYLRPDDAVVGAATGAGGG